VINIPLPLLADAIPQARCIGRPDVFVRRIITNSHDVRSGDLFACVRGKTVDGHRFATAAIQQGATALLVDRSPLPGWRQMGIGMIQVKDVQQTLKTIAPRFYNYPSLRLGLIGITGTNGKTTVSYLLRSILQSQRVGKRSAHCVGLIGTIQHEISGKRILARNTTPMAWEIQDLLHEMVAAGCDIGIMEVSSHALSESRITGCEFDVAIFTNLTRDHLDYHRTLKRYAAAKRKLFTQLVQPGVKQKRKYAIVNQDDLQAQAMIQAASGARVITYALENNAEVRAEDLRLSPQGSTFRLRTPQGRIDIRLRLLGRYNVLNALAAAAAAYGLGVPLSTIQAGLKAVSGVPGRMEKLPGQQPFAVVVDYAHTPDALEKVLQATREYTRNRIILVFGCGGDRDISKRVPMGAIAAKLADEIVVTSDNPRREDPRKIIRDVLEGCHRAMNHAALGEKLHVEIDRSRAIALALQRARPHDTVIIAGKGHEKYQIFKNKTIVFDDSQVAQAALAQLFRRV